MLAMQFLVNSQAGGRPTLRSYVKEIGTFIFTWLFGHFGRKVDY